MKKQKKNEAAKRRDQKRATRKGKAIPFYSKPENRIQRGPTVDPLALWGGIGLDALKKGQVKS